MKKYKEEAIDEIEKLPFHLFNKTNLKALLEELEGDDFSKLNTAIRIINNTFKTAEENQFHFDVLTGVE